MRERIHRYYQTVLLLIMAAVLLTACSSDGSDAQTISTGDASKDHVVHLVSYASGYMEAATTRSAPSGYSDYLPDKAVVMGVYVLPENYNALEEQLIKYDGAKWHATFSVDKNKNYAVYGYLPKAAGMSSSLTKSAPDAATLTLTGMKPITTDDICIITGVKETNVGLKEGQFSWYTPVGVDTYYINILMDHLYAAVMFSMKIDTDYANLRTIKLKKMELSTNKESVKATISLKHNTTGASPVTGVTYTPSGSSYTAEIFSSEEGTALDKKTPLVINSCFAPTLSNNLTLVTTYDVYDSKDNLIRQNCTATNKLPNLEAVRAQRVQVNMTVNPTYLYVLSEPDLDNPTIKLKIDN